VFKSVRIGNGELDVGQIAEALVYYGRVVLSLRSGGVPDLVKVLGYEPLIDLMDMGALILSIDRHITSVRTEKVGNLEVHFLDHFSLTAGADGTKIESIEDEIRLQFRRKIGANPQADKQALSIASRVVVPQLDTTLSAEVLADVKDRDLLSQFIRAYLGAVVPGYRVHDNLKAEIATVKDGLVLLGNIDFPAINQIYHQFVPPSHSSITRAYVLANILDAARELKLAAGVETDLWVGAGISAILKMRISEIAAKLSRSKEDIAYFHDVEFEGRNFRDAVTGDNPRTGAELVSLLQQQEAQKFKLWLSTQEPNARLLKEYDRAVLAENGLTRKLPFRLGKVAVFTGLGVIADALLGTMGLATAAASGLTATSEFGLGAVDEFVVPRLLNGWKPNQFIEGPASSFLKDRNDF